MGRRTHRQLALPAPPTWGGVRKGAGRRPTGQFGRDPRGRPLPGVGHGPRPTIDARHPLHVTLRATNGFPSMRHLTVAKEIGKVLKRRARRELPCRVVHFSIQRDHIHLIIEAADRVALARGIQGVASGIARVVNRTTGCHGMKLWRDRYHARPLRTPTEVRRALVYVLRNSAKRWVLFAVDPLSSAAWFDGFLGRPPVRTDPAPTVAPTTWLLTTGWRARGGGPIRLGEMPRSVPA
jgi:REP element-mobilizing transposase RayT